MKLIKWLREVLDARDLSLGKTAHNARYVVCAVLSKGAADASKRTYRVDSYSKYRRRMSSFKVR